MCGRAQELLDEAIPWTSNPEYQKIVNNSTMEALRDRAYRESPIILSNEIEKVHRWLGFIQGILWTQGIFTINEMREQNR